MYTHPETAERVAAPTTFMTKGNATRWLATTEADLFRGEALDPRGAHQRFGAYADAWLASKKNLRPLTVDLYAYLLRVHIGPTFGDITLGRITTAGVRGWYHSLASGELSQTTAAKAYRLLRQILQTAVDDRMIRANPCRVKGAATERSRERKIPSIEEVRRLADVIEPRYRSMVLLAAFAGLRRGECLGLRRCDVTLDADPPTVTVERSIVESKAGLLVQAPKTNAGFRTLALPAAVVDELRKHVDAFVGKDPDAAVFTSSAGATPARSTWRRVWISARDEAGLDCTFHDLRHVAGTLNAAAGATVKEAMARLGHASPVAALRYQHAVQARDAVIASGVDKLLGVVDEQSAQTDPSQSGSVRTAAS